jgi:hypothetical protein
MTKGIILIAVGHDNYHKMAECLANSIRHNCGEELRICLVSDRPNNENKLFTDFIDLPKTDLHPLRIKAKLNELTPFDKTLYLDVDMISTMNKKISDLLDIETDFMIQNLGECFKSDWADVDQIKKEYGIDKLTAIFSECILWTKGEFSDRIFKKWDENFDNIRVQYRRFSDGVPDELPLMIALAELQIVPEKWTPIYWRGHGREMLKLSMGIINERYYGYSIGGNASDEKMKQQYDILSRHFAMVRGVRFPLYLHKAKRKWNTARVVC